MPNQCTRCDNVYPDDAPELLTGCACGNSVFAYKRPEEPDLPETHVHKDPIQSTEDGKYDLDLHGLFSKDLVVYKEGDGKYRVDLQATFKKTLQ
jgi:predicted  nucleic acid-binding Zn-ribbon protein